VDPVTPARELRDEAVRNDAVAVRAMIREQLGWMDDEDRQWPFGHFASCLGKP
jgi:hypothetical protein